MAADTMENQTQLLNYLKTILASGSITAAAKKLYISQPYLSRYIHEAEAKLGAPLLDRKQRPIALTDIGATYLQGLETLDNNYKQLLNDITEMTYPETTHIRLGINQSISSRIVSTILQQYLAKFPNHHISIEELPSQDLEKKLLNHDIDFHLRMLPIFPNNISYKCLATLPVYLIVNRSSPLFIPGNTKILPINLSPENIQAADFIVLHSGSGFMRLIELYLSSRKLTIKPKFEMRYIESAVRMAYAGLGCTFVPEMFIKPHFDARHCNVYRLLPEESLSVNLVLAYLKDQPLTPTFQTFMETLQGIEFFD